MRFLRLNRNKLAADPALEQRLRSHEDAIEQLQKLLAASNKKALPPPDAPAPTILTDDGTFQEPAAVATRSWLGPWTAINIANTEGPPATDSDNFALIASTITNLSAGQRLKTIRPLKVTGMMCSLRGVAAGNDGKISVRVYRGTDASPAGSFTGASAFMELDDAANQEYWFGRSFAGVPFGKGQILSLRYRTGDNADGNGWNATNADCIVWLEVLT